MTHVVSLTFIGDGYFSTHDDQMKARKGHNAQGENTFTEKPQTRLSKAEMTNNARLSHL